MKPRNTFLSLLALNQKTKTGNDIHLLDVRTRAEYADGHAVGALSEPLEELDAKRLIVRHGDRERTPMVENLTQLIQNSFDKNADRTAIRVLRQLDQQGERRLRYVPMTYRQLQEQRDHLVLGLSVLGLQNGHARAFLKPQG